MIRAVAFVPQAPALDPEIGRGLETELGPLREACRTAIRRVAGSSPIEVLGDDPDGVGEYLVQDALGARPIRGSDVLVVVGDGSARRTEKAPGYYDERAEAFDAGVVSALRSGDPAQLAAIDVDLGAELLAAGAPVWQRVGGELTGRYDAEVLYDDAPFGVGYVVAVWTAVWTPRAEH